MAFKVVVREELNPIELEFFDWVNGNSVSYDIVMNKYRYKGETLDEMCMRIAGQDNRVAQLIKDKTFIFGGRTMANRGTTKAGSYSNCYSHGFVEDDMKAILETNVNLGMTYKSQGGQGVSLSKIRPKGAGINNDQYTSDGIIPIMEIFNQTTLSTSQGGSRKGALIMSLDAWHKEAEDFIKVKSETNKITAANLSLEINNNFMQIVEEDLKNDTYTERHVKQAWGKNQSVEYTVCPRRLYEVMVERAFNTGEPGCIFVDRFRNYNIMEYIDTYQIESCNPCGEQPLPRHGACNLGSINLSNFVLDPFTDNARFSIDSFKKAVELSVEALDTVLDENLENHALLEQKIMAEKYRNIGLGVMGLWDCLVKMGYKYGSQQAVEFTGMVISNMFRFAVMKSSEMAKEFGSFPGYDPKVWDSKIIKAHFNSDEIAELKANGLRNCSLLSIAPTGSIGTMLNISTGCEPAFAFKYNRRTVSLNGEETTYTVIPEAIQEYFRVHPEETELPDYFVKAGDINWRDRIKMQAILQESVDTAISSTVNLPEETKLEDVKMLYLEAWKAGLKGITIYWDGCARQAILSTKKDKPVKEEPTETLIVPQHGNALIPTTDNTISCRRKLTIGCGVLHCVSCFTNDGNVNLDSMYLAKGSEGGCQSNQIALSRMMSYAARVGGTVEGIIDQLLSVPACVSYVAARYKTACIHKECVKPEDLSPNKCFKCEHNKGGVHLSKGSSCPSAVAYALKEMVEEAKAKNEVLNGCNINVTENGDIEVETTAVPKHTEYKKIAPLAGAMECPACHEITYVKSNGCGSCTACGYSTCD